MDNNMEYELVLEGYGDGAEWYNSREEAIADMQAWLNVYGDETAYILAWDAQENFVERIN